MKRLFAIIVCLVFLTVSAGCLGSGLDLGLGDENVANSKNTNYTWNTSADATLTVGSDHYQSVYKLDKKTLEAYTYDTFGQETSLEVGAVKYLYPNGTVITPNEKDSFTVEKSQKRTTIHVPKADGRVAFVAEKSGRAVMTPVFVDSGEMNGPSYEIILPENTAVSVPLLSSVRPNNYETKSVDGRVHIMWQSVESDSISARYYHQRDFFIFGGIASLLTVGGLVGLVYYLVQIRRLERLRKEIGFDIDTGEDRP